MSNITIGIVLPYLKARGTEKQALRLATGFIKRGSKVVVFVAQGWGLPGMYQAFEMAGVEVVNVGPAANEGEKKVKLSRVWSLAHLAKKHRCAVLLSRAGLANKITGYAGRISSIPTVVVLSSAIQRRPYKSFHLKRCVLSLRRFYTLGFPKHIISVSKEGAENFSHNYPFLSTRITAIQNGVELISKVEVSSEVTLPPGVFYFCYSGSIEIKRKGIDVLVNAFNNIIKGGAGNICLVLIGTGEDEEKIKKQIKKQNIEDQVLMMGEKDDPVEIMAQCHAFVLPSRKEGLPNALLEAMSIGLCCISSDCDTGPREIITHGKDGLLVTNEDSVAMSNAMLEVMGNKSLRQQLGQQAVKTIEEKFSYEKMVDYYHLLLKKIK